MRFEDISIKYCGFHPSEFMQTYLESLLHEIHEEAPYGASLRATFIRRERELKGIVRINSAAGSFMAIASGRGLHDVAKHLLDQMRRKLSKWKSRRFGPDSLRRSDYRMPS